MQLKKKPKSGHHFFRMCEKSLDSAQALFPYHPRLIDQSCYGIATCAAAPPADAGRTRGCALRGGRGVGRQ